jgi:dolichol-phosphate mannosyltransferase
MLSIIIPTYNERQNISDLVGKLNAAIDCEIVFVDDNSPDGTALEIEKISERCRNVCLVKRPGKLGLTGAIVEGVRASSGDILVVMDADLSHPPEKIPALIASLKSNDLAVGSRMLRGGGVKSWPIHRRLISRAAEALARAVLGVRCTDPLSGFFALKRGIIENTRFRTRGYKLLLNIIYDNPGIKIAEVPYVFSDRQAGKTKLGMIEILAYPIDLLRIRLGRDGGRKP